MKTFILITSLLWALCSTQLHAQDMACATDPNVSNNDYGSEANYVDPTNDCKITVNVYFHLVGRSDGSARPNSSTPQQMTNKLNSTFNQWKIFFNNIGYDEINNSQYGGPSALTISNYTGMFSVNPQSNAIDVYVVPSDATTFGAVAAGIPSKALIIPYGLAYVGGNLTDVTSHEMGHCLNLFHTFHGTAESGACAELVNSSNSTTCGDFISDTPADPVNNPNNCQNNCNYNPVAGQCSTQDANGDAYSPNLHNIMSYGQPTCLNYYTYRQANRMRVALRNASILLPVRSISSDAFDNDNVTVDYNTITSTPTFVSPGQHMVRLVMFGNPGSISWSVNPSSVLIYSSGAQCAFALNSGQGCTISVTASSSCGGPQSRNLSFQAYSGYRVAPNPVTTTMEINFDRTDYVEALPDEINLLSEKSTKPIQSISLKDVFDRKAFKDGNKVEFDVKNLPRGTYYVHVINHRKKNNEVDAIRVILE